MLLELNSIRQKRSCAEQILKDAKKTHLLFMQKMEWNEQKKEDENSWRWAV